MTPSPTPQPVPLDERIRRWLEEQGYPLEMRVARAFQQRKFRVFQSEYYADPDSDQQRETDVVASKQKEFGDILVRIRVVLECKRTPEKPWLLFTAPTRLAPPARVAQRCGSKLGRAVLHAFAQIESIQSLGLFSLADYSAYAITQAFTSGADITFAAAMSVAKASQGMAREIDKSEHFSGRIAEVIFPAIVVEAPLFDCRLDENDDVIVRNVSHGTLLWRNPVGGSPHTIIRILTTAELPNFVSEVEATIEGFMHQCGSSLPLREKVIAADRPAS